MADSGSGKEELGADLSITINIIYSSAVAAIIYILFVILRGRIRWLYTPNVSGKKSHPVWSYSKKALGWIHPVLFMEDKELVTLVGLDAFTFIQTIKLLFHIILFSSFISLAVLLPLYIAIPDDNTQLFFSLSILALPEKSPFYWLPFAVCLIVSLVAYYLIFIFYKNYALMRQAWNRNPAATTSFYEVMKVNRGILLEQQNDESHDSNSVKWKESVEKTYDIVNLPSKAVFVRDLPSYITCEQDLFAYGERLNVGKVRDAILVKDTAVIRTLSVRKESLIAQLETFVLKFMLNINRESKKKDSKLQNIIEIDAGFDIMAEALNSTDSSLTSLSDEKLRILEILRDLNFLSDYRPKISRKIEGKRTKVDAINHILNEMEQIDRDIRFQRDLSEKELELSAHQSFEKNAMETQEFYETYHRSVDNITYISFRDLWDFVKKSHARSNGPQKAGFIVFDEIVSPNILKQCLVDSNLLSCTVKAAPQSRDLIWENLNISPSKRFAKRTIGSIASFVFSILFFLAVMGLSTILSLTTLKLIFPSLENLEKYPVLLGIVNGILGPLALNLMLLIAPKVFYYLSKFQGKESESFTQLSMLTKYNWFMLVNAFLAFLFTKLLINVIVVAVNGETDTLIEDFGRSMVNQSVFFTNFVIQKFFVDLAMQLLKPVSLLIRMLVKYWKREQKTPRTLYASKQPAVMDYGSSYPGFVVIFPICISYACISPLTLVAGTFFFGLAYYVIRHEFIYSLQTCFESGGQHWFRNYRFIMVSLMVFQIATAVVFSLRKAFVQSSFLVVLVAFTLIMIFYIEHILKRRAEYLPLNVEEDIYINAFTKDFEKRQIDLLTTWEENEDTTKRLEDIPYGLIVKSSDLQKVGESEELKHIAHAYRDPVLFSSARVIMLPDLFFAFFKILLDKSGQELYQV